MLARRICSPQLSRAFSVPVFCNQWGIKRSVPDASGRLKYAHDVAELFEATGVHSSLWIWRSYRSESWGFELVHEDLQRRETEDVALMRALELAWGGQSLYDVNWLLMDEDLMDEDLPGSSRADVTNLLAPPPPPQPERLELGGSSPPCASSQTFEPVPAPPPPPPPLQVQHLQPPPPSPPRPLPVPLQRPPLPQGQLKYHPPLPHVEPPPRPPPVETPARTPAQAPALMLPPSQAHLLGSSPSTSPPSPSPPAPVISTRTACPRPPSSLSPPSFPPSPPLIPGGWLAGVLHQNAPWALEGTGAAVVDAIDALDSSSPHFMLIASVTVTVVLLLCLPFWRFSSARRQRRQYRFRRLKRQPEDDEDE